MLLLLDYVNSDRSSTGLEGFYTPVLKQMADLQGSKFAKVGRPAGTACTICGAVV